MNNILPIIGYGLLSAVISFFITPSYIRMLQKLKISKQIRQDATIGKAKEFHKLHKHKAGTPTMGGGIVLMMVFLMVLISLILLGLKNQIGLDLNNSLLSREETYLSLFTLASLGILGFIDDIFNILGIGKTKGLSARVKMIGLIVFAAIGSYWFFYRLGYNTVSIPFAGEVFIGWWYIPLAVLILISMANSVNITDGLDGLAGGLLIQNYILYAIITYMQGLLLLSTLCVVIIGALVSFLWFNIKPAKFYMGDIGSITLGANLGVIAIMTDTLAVLIIIALPYIFEILTVIAQLLSKKYRKKKIFRIAPYHHHLEAIGLSEETIVMKFWLLGGMFTVIGFITFVLLG